MKSGRSSKVQQEGHDLTHFKGNPLIVVRCNGKLKTHGDESASLTFPICRYILKKRDLKFQMQFKVREGGEKVGE